MKYQTPKPKVPDDALGACRAPSFSGVPILRSALLVKKLTSTKEQEQEQEEEQEQEQEELLLLLLLLLATLLLLLLRSLDSQAGKEADWHELSDL